MNLLLSFVKSTNDIAAEHAIYYPPPPCCLLRTKVPCHIKKIFTVICYDVPALGFLNAFPTFTEILLAVNYTFFCQCSPPPLHVASVTCTCFLPRTIGKLIMMMVISCRGISFQMTPQAAAGGTLHKTTTTCTTTEGENCSCYHPYLKCIQ